MIDAITIPAEQCCWVRLPPSARRWTRDRILAGIEPWIPSDVDRLDLCWARGSDGQVLVLACKPDQLDRFLAEHPPAWVLKPDRIPAHVVVPGVTPEDLNLRCGRLAPAGQRRAESALMWTAILTTTAVILVMAAGAIRHRAGIITRQQAAIAAINLDIPTALGGNDPDPLLRLDQAERLANSLSHAATGADGSGAAAFSAVLAAWPAQLRLQVTSLAIDANRCTISGTAQTVDDAQAVANALAGAFASQAGWRMLPLQASSAGTTTAFTCTAVREVAR